MGLGVVGVVAGGIGIVAPEPASTVYGYASVTASATAIAADLNGRIQGTDPEKIRLRIK